MARQIACQTSSFRHDGALNCDITEIASNYVPYPGINALLTSHSIQDPSDKESYNQSTFNLFKPGNQSADIGDLGKLMSCGIMFNGNWAPKNIG